jgi:glucose-6-phosphate 1-dehydrogenase
VSREKCNQRRPSVDLTTIVIFGASGDLTRRKLIPALYNNVRKGRLPKEYRILGTARRKFSTGTFRETMREAIKASAGDGFREEMWREFAERLYYLSANPDNPDDYPAIREAMGGDSGSPGNVLYYLALPPPQYPAVIARLGEAGMADEEGGFRRIVIEKPFGVDLTSAIDLNRRVHAVFREDQAYRIDHYLGKETVQNVLVLRFGNAIFEPLWNRNYVDHVQITVTETVGVEHRAGYYDGAGVLRDVFQNHLLQLLSLVAMEPPTVYSADALRDEKVKVLTALRELPPESVRRQTVRARYNGYLNEPDVNARSTTATYAALKLYIDNWRWQGVPFYLRSGKKLAKKTSEIVVQFRRPPLQLFDTHTGVTELFTNRLSICIQPDEGMHLCFITKVPDHGMQTRPVHMDFHFRDSFGDGGIPEAYERLLVDAVKGDPSLFARSDEIEQAWKIIDSIQAGWEDENAPPIVSYEAGSWGPHEAEALLAHDGRWWIHDCSRHTAGIHLPDDENNA